MLKISPTLSLPLEAVTQTFGILAVRGAGKTNAGVVMAEEMFKADLPFVAVDPVGSWWGMRSSKDGKGPGLSIAIFGGEHGDIPLEKTGGHQLAELVASERLTCVLDVSSMSEGDKIRFLTDFAERLFQKNRDPLHLFLEEADDYAPQRPMRDQPRLLGAWQRIVKRGRAKGIGATMISQRSAALNKDLLTQIETLVVLRTTSPQDHKAIGAWVEYHAESRELLKSLGTLADGEAWIWSPQFLKTSERIQFRRRGTFDSGATPDVKGRRAPARLADVDLGAIEAQMKETIERAKAEDPKELRRSIQTLNARIRELEARPASQEVVEVVKEVRVEVPVPREVLFIDETTLARMEKALDPAVSVLSEIQELAVAARIAAAAIREESARRVPISPPQVREQERKPRPDPLLERALPRPESAPAPNGEITDYMDRLLNAFGRRHPMTMTRTQLSLLSGYSRRSSSFDSSISKLSKLGLIRSSGGQMGLTPEGEQVAGVDGLAPSTPAETRAMWRESLSRSEATIFDVLVEAGDWMTRALISERTGYSMTSSSFDGAISSLRRAGLVVVDQGMVGLAEELIG